MGQGNSRREPLVTDLWLVVDEEQTLHYGLRRAWRWLEHEPGEHNRAGRGQSGEQGRAEEECSCGA